MKLLHCPFIVMLLMALVAPLAACHRESKTLLPATQMTLASQTFTLEIATSPHDQEVGLMHRDHLDADHGMIFIFPDVQKRDFWNHDVHFPLDVVFLDAGETIVSIKHMKPYSDLDISSDFPAKFAIELNGGTAANIGLKTGMHLQVPGTVLDAPSSPK